MLSEEFVNRLVKMIEAGEADSDILDAIHSQQQDQERADETMALVMYVANYIKKYYMPDLDTASLAAVPAEEYYAYFDKAVKIAAPLLKISPSKSRGKRREVAIDNNSVSIADFLNQYGLL